MSETGYKVTPGKEYITRCERRKLNAPLAVCTNDVIKYIVNTPVWAHSDMGTVSRECAGEEEGSGTLSVGRDNEMRLLAVEFRTMWCDYLRERLGAYWLDEKHPNNKSVTQWEGVQRRTRGGYYGLWQLINFFLVRVLPTTITNNTRHWQKQSKLPA